MQLGNSQSSDSWVLALTTLAAGAALFLPLHDRPSTVAIGDWLSTAGSLRALLALTLAAVGFWVFRQRFWPRGPHELQRLRSGSILFVLQALLLRGAIELAPAVHHESWTWLPLDPWLWTPWFLSAGLAVMLLGSRLGVLISVSGVFILYLRVDPGPLPLVGCLVASLTGIVLLRRSTRLRVLRAGAVSGAILALVGLVDAIHGGVSWMTLVASAVIPAAIGLLSAFIVLAFLPVMEWILGELSDVTLVEYATDHPLLDQLKEQAPGTWHHTLNVADLAEKAAAVIGARALFCRTAALYHDVGKLKQPEIFAENINGPSPHEHLDPQTSAQRIIEHVTYGLELARKHRLPSAFREIIAEHHGISMVRFFYTKACEQLPEGEDPERLRPLFTYPGPPPSSRESGIIALADIVEAASRAVAVRSEDEARVFVRRLIADRIAEGELAQCPLTLAELAQVEETFVGWVKARHHQRPSYPRTAAPSSEETSEWTKSGRAAAQPA